MTRDPAAICPAFRVLAWILAPMFLFMSGIVGPAMAIHTLVDEGWRQFGRDLPLFLGLIGPLPLGLLLWRAARTGRDPYLEKE